MQEALGRLFVIQLKNESVGYIVIFLAYKSPKNGTTSHTKGNFIKRVV